MTILDEIVDRTRDEVRRRRRDVPEDTLRGRLRPHGEGRPFAEALASRDGVSVIAEHKAVRSSVGVFDVSHLGRLALSGAEATDVLRSRFTNDVTKYEPGRTHYTMLLNDRGGIVDDIMVWRWDEHDYWVMPNAANSDRVRDDLAAAGATVEDLRPTTAMFAVQGPDASGVLEKVFGDAPARFRTLATENARLAGTGYTGEKGGELVVGAEAAANLLSELVEAGCVPCGLGARDTLRLESGLALWGSDIDETTTPLEAGLDFAVDWDHPFPGREALLEQRRQGAERRLTGLVMQERGIPRHGHAVRAGDSTGSITSGNISPMLDTGIALAYLSPPVDLDVAAEVEIRNKWLEARVAKPPFHR